MKHLRLFKTEVEYNSATLELPNVSYVEEIKGVSYIPKVDEPTQTYNMVDLGLPSGLLWADRNIGASSPEDPGLYFAWGETVGYTPEQVANGEKIFDWNNYFDTTDGGYEFNKYNLRVGGLTELDASDDAATVNMGAEYRIPSLADFSELRKNTTVTYVDIYGNEYDPEVVYGMLAPDEWKGVKFTGSNDNSIFIPTEDLYHEELVLWGNSINFPVGSDSGRGRIAEAQWFDIDGGMTHDRDYRCMGRCVRGVK